MQPRKISLGHPKRVPKQEVEAAGSKSEEDSKAAKSIPEGDQDRTQMVASDNQVGKVLDETETMKPTEERKLAAAAVDETKDLSKTRLKVYQLPKVPTWDEIQARKNNSSMAVPKTQANENNDDNATHTAQILKSLPAPPPMTIAANRDPRKAPLHQTLVSQPGPNQEVNQQQQNATIQPAVLASVSQRISNDMATFGGGGMLGSRVEVSGSAYRIIKEIGRGGTSTVFCALREDNINHKDSLVALKHVIGTENVHALKEEIALLTKLRTNPYVIQYVASDVSAGSIGMLVMELGQTDISSCVTELSTNKETGKRDIKLHQNTVRYFFQGMVEAVQAIHECRIVHGDLKPANFVFVRGRIKLIDFGIAKSIREDTINITRDNQTGTMNYIPPEALMANANNQYKLSCKADVWSLGCILYNLVYGAPPFHDVVPLVRKIYAITSPQHEIRFPRITGDVTDLSLIDAMQRCLQRDVEKRIGIPGPHGLLSHPFIAGGIPPGTVPQKLLARAVAELTYRAGEVYEMVGVVSAKAETLATEFTKNMLQTGRVAESLDYALNQVQLPRKALMAVTSISAGPPQTLLDKENLVTPGVRSARPILT